MFDIRRFQLHHSPLALPCHNEDMKKGIIAGICAAGFVLVCFLGINAFQIWAVNANRIPFGGFPLPYYNRFGDAAIATLDSRIAFLNYFLTSSIALHVAFGVLALFNARTILRHVVAGRNGKAETWVRNGIIAGFWAAGFIMACFTVVNAYQMWGVYSITGYRDVAGFDEAGFPVTCYSRGGVGGAWLDIEAVFLNYFIASSVALHVAFGILVLYTARAILQRFFASRNGKADAGLRNGIIAGLWTAGFIMACFMVVNVYQLWGVYFINGYRDAAGFPLICYERKGVAGIALLDWEDAIYNYFIASSAAFHIALSVFALFNARAIVRRIVMWIRR